MKVWQWTILALTVAIAGVCFYALVIAALYQGMKDVLR